MGVLTLYRRHKESCKNAAKRYERKDKCPIWCEGTIEGSYLRKSLKTRSWERADELRLELERGAKSPSVRIVSVSDAIQIFMTDCRARLRSLHSIRKYALVSEQLQAFASSRGITDIRELTFDKLVEFRAGWKEKSEVTKLKKLERVRSFFKFFHDAGYIPSNPAKAIKPGNPPRIKIKPFTDLEQQIIISKNCLPRTRAFINVLFYSALRMSDTVMLRPEDLDGDNIRRSTTKTGEVVYIPIPPELGNLLRSLRLNAGYFFLQGESEYHATQSDYWRGVLKEIFIDEIPKFHPHRFRHTAAVNWLLAGLSIEDVASFLGNSVRIVEKHYLSWCPKRHERAAELLKASWKNKPAKLKLVK